MRKITLLLTIAALAFVSCGKEEVDPSRLYLVKIGNYPARRVVVIR